MISPRYVDQITQFHPFVQHGIKLNSDNILAEDTLVTNVPIIMQYRNENLDPIGVIKLSNTIPKLREQSTFSALPLTEQLSITKLNLWFPRHKNQEYSLTRNLKQIQSISVVINDYVMYSISQVVLQGLLLSRANQCTCCIRDPTRDTRDCCDFFDQRQDFELPILNQCRIACFHSAQIHVSVASSHIFAKPEAIATPNKNSTLLEQRGQLNSRDVVISLILGTVLSVSDLTAIIADYTPNYSKSFPTCRYNDYPRLEITTQKSTIKHFHSIRQQIVNKFQWSKHNLTKTRAISTADNKTYVCQNYFRYKTLDFSIYLVDQHDEIMANSISNIELHLYLNDYDTSPTTIIRGVIKHSNKIFQFLFLNLEHDNYKLVDKHCPNLSNFQKVLVKFDLAEYLVCERSRLDVCMFSTIVAPWRHYGN